jgi:hypothetical protein
MCDPRIFPSISLDFRTNKPFSVDMNVVFRKWCHYAILSRLDGAVKNCRAAVSSKFELESKYNKHMREAESTRIQQSGPFEVYILVRHQVKRLLPCFLVALVAYRHAQFIHLATSSTLPLATCRSSRISPKGSVRHSHSWNFDRCCSR